MEKEDPGWVEKENQKKINPLGRQGGRYTNETAVTRATVRRKTKRKRNRRAGLVGKNFLKPRGRKTEEEVDEGCEWQCPKS